MAMTTMTKTLIVAALLLPTAWAIGEAAQIQRPPSTPLVIKSTYGADLYQFYCSSCHGATGRGGSARSETGQPPPDLTVLAAANGNVFPRDRVRSTITFGKADTAIRAHGTAAMPVWGTIFRGLEPSDAMTELRIENLVRFIETLQDRPKGEEHRQ
jgi:mono/diheme cytochrome c family protein